MHSKTAVNIIIVGVGINKGSGLLRIYTVRACLGDIKKKGGGLRYINQTNRS